MNKETIAKAGEALYNHWVSSKHGLFPSWDVMLKVNKVPYYQEAKAVLKALEAEVPKELEDCLPSEEQIQEEIDERYIGDLLVSNYAYIARQIAKAQLAKVAEYVEAERNKIFKALASYNMGRISGERCAEIIGMNALEFYDKF